MTTRNTTVRDKHRRTISKTKPPCHLCGNPIDYDADWLDPLAFTVDHVIPLAKHGADTLANKAAAHRKCNRDKSDTIPGVSFVTNRQW